MCSNEQKTGPVPQRVQREMERLMHYLHGPSHSLAERLWEDGLNDHERQRLGGTVEEAIARHHSPLAMMMQARNLPRDLALSDAALPLGFIDFTGWRRLDKALIKHFPELAASATVVCDPSLRQQLVAAKMCAKIAPPGWAWARRRKRALAD